jgi:GIY-YIG catalytic domain
VREEPFPGFREFSWDIDEINSVPLLWQEVLKNVKGVYLLACRDTGKQYVGSAKGAESLWGRFLEHAKKEFGDSVQLKKLGSRHLQVTVLEVVNSDTGIERVEEAWMKKLMTRKFGLN